MVIKVSVILLAAGLSSRMGEDKLLLKYKGKSFLQHSLDLLQKLPVYERIIVTNDARQRHIVLPNTIKLCINPNPERGQSSSIKIGIEEASGTHYLFLVADQPLLTKKDLIPLLDAVKTKPGKIIFPIVDSEPNSPSLFPSTFKDELIKLNGDKGGRVIREANKDLWYTIHPENPENFTDIDNEAQYINLK